MAKIEDHILMQGLSGTINHQVYKTYHYGTVVSKVPDMSQIVPSEEQKAKRARFKRAVTYAKEVLADPVKKAEMACRTPPGKLVYHQAIREYLANHPD